MNWRAETVVAGAVLALALAGTAQAGVATVTVTPATADVPTAGTLVLTALVSNPGGVPIEGETVDWQVDTGGTLSDATGTTDANGETTNTFTAGAAADTATVTATAGGVSGTATISVYLSVSTTITLSPASALLNPDEVQDFTVEVLDQFDQPIAAAITWSVSSNGTLSNESDTGVTYTADSVADTDVLTADAGGGLTATADITVEAPVLTTVTVSPATVTMPAGGTQDFTVEKLDQFGQPIAATITWSVSSNGTLTNESDTGVTYTADSAADADVLTADAGGGLTATADITVEVVAAVSVVITPAAAGLAPLGTKTFTAAALDQFGQPVTVTIDWDDGGAGGSFDTTTGETVVYTAPASEQTVTLTATADGVTDTATVVVVDPANVLMKLDCGTNTPTAGWESGNNYVTGGADYTWTPGTWDLSAANAAPEEVYLNVRHQEHSYDIPTLPDGDYTVRFHFCEAYPGAFRAMDYTIEGVEVITDLDPGTEAGGNYIALPWDMAVTVSDGNGLQIGASWDVPGPVDCFEAGMEIIGGAPVGPVLTSITVTPAGVVLGVDATQVFTAEALDQAGDPMDPQPTITWTLTGDGSIDPATGASTTYTAPSTDGSATLTASADSVEGSATITVSSAAVVAGVTVTPATANAAPGGTVVLTATVVDQYGDPIVTDVTWEVTGDGTVDPTSGTTDDVLGETTTTLTAGTTEGTITVTASAGGFSDAATVTVAVAPVLVVTTITVTPATSNIYTSGTVTLTATALDQNSDPIAADVTLDADAGGTLDTTTGTTSAADGTITTIFTSDGTTGTFTVTVTSGAVSGTATVTVSVQSTGDDGGCVPASGGFGLGMALLVAALAVARRRRQ